jgi:hypothetical protein
LGITPLIVVTISVAFLVVNKRESWYVLHITILQ